MIRALPFVGGDEEGPKVKPDAEDDEYVAGPPVIDDTAADTQADDGLEGLPRLPE